MKTPALLLCVSALSFGSSRQFDVVVYGGTASGVMASVSAAREGLKAALIEPGNHLGGMVSGGLGCTDYGRKEVIGGLAREFYSRIGKRYEMVRYGHELAWMHEPHVAEQVFREMLQQAGVSVFEQTRLKEHGGVTVRQRRVASIQDEQGGVFEAAIFIDASYEGDLMAQAGITWTYGRESQEQYGESLAGVRDTTPEHQFLVDVPAFGLQGKLLPEISNAKLLPPGSADKAVQAYNYRMCFSSVAANQTPFERPSAYDPARFELLVRLLQAQEKADEKPQLRSLLKIDALPNGKTDINNMGAFSTDFIGGSWRYPVASYAEREQIRQAHKDYMQGLFYFLANDPRDPEPVRVEMGRWGLCKDEFTDTNHWPNQLYIREGRRMVGEFVMTQKDLQTERTKPDPVGMGSYNSDSHNVQRIVDAKGFVRNEGNTEVPVEPYQIPYRVMTPKRAEVINLLVPVAFSASHVAYSSLRMEPQYMILGQAAGVAAKLAIQGNAGVQGTDTKALTDRLRALGAVMEYTPRTWD
jgi:hypothetical protein